MSGGDPFLSVGAAPKGRYYIKIYTKNPPAVSLWYCMLRVQQNKLYPRA